MRVKLDDGLCCGHGRCYALCPEVFEDDDAGHAVLRLEAVPPDLEAKVRAAAENCPERAISIGESGTDAA